MVREKKLLNDGYLWLSPCWKRAIEIMLIVQKKSSFEVLHDKGYSYVAEEFLPEKVRSVIGIDANKIF